MCCKKKSECPFINCDGCQGCIPESRRAGISVSRLNCFLCSKLEGSPGNPICGLPHAQLARASIGRRRSEEKSPYFT